MSELFVKTTSQNLTKARGPWQSNKTNGPYLLDLLLLLFYLYSLYNKGILNNTTLTLFLNELPIVF